MLRDLIELGPLQDFLDGVARESGLSVDAFDSDARRIAASGPRTEFARLDPCLVDTLPPDLEFGPPRAEVPPERVAFFQHRGLWRIVAPVQLNNATAGYAVIGELRGPDAHEPPPSPSGRPAGNPQVRRRAWEKLQSLDRSPDAQPVRTALWVARMLTNWCRSELHLDRASNELSLLGDISELLSDVRDLQPILDRIVRETSRVMKCRYSSLRLYNPRTDELRISAAYNLSQRYKDIGVILRSHSLIDDAALDGELVYIEDAQTDARIRFHDEACRLGIHSGLTAGLIHRGKSLGVLRVYSEHRKRFRASDRNLLRAVASQAATAIDSARLVEERLRAAELERQLALAGDLQARLTRTAPPRHERVETARIYAPSSHLSGDFCDIFSLANGHLAAVVGDAVGHGAGAALLMAAVRGALRAIAESTSDLAQLVGRLNRFACRDTSSSEFVTFLIVAVDATASTLRYCCAGHESPMLLRRGELMQPDEGGLVLGLDPHESYDEHRLELRPGDFLLLYTDGVVEALNFDGELFGRRRLIKLVKRYGRLPPEQALRNIHWDLRRFVGLAEQIDDQTLVGLRVRA